MTPAASTRMPRAPLMLGTRFLRILWRMLPALLVSLNVVAWSWLLGGSDAIKQQAYVIALAIVGFRLASALVAEVLSPYRPGMRMIPMSDARASRMATVIRALLYVLLGTQAMIYLVHANGWNESVASLVLLVRQLGLILFTAMAISRTGLLAKIGVERVVGYVDLARRLLVRVVFPGTVLTLMFVVTVSALGYQAMAEWVWTSAVGSGIAFIVVSVVARFLKIRLNRSVAFIEAHGRDVTYADEGGGPDAEVPDDGDPDLPPEADPTWIGIERIGDGLITLMSVVVVSVWITSIWGIEVAHLERMFAASLVAGWGPTWGDVFAAITLVVATVLVARLLSTILIFIVFPRADVDAGARYAILAILRYVMYFVAGYMGFSRIGFDTSALTVFAGAFGVALAFGLQDIFSNFLSGLIMLVERPVRVGDLIQVGTTTGRVEAIKLRGTTLRVFDNSTITIPNSQMLGERLTNLSHNMEYARVQIEVSTPYDTDPTRVIEILLDITNSDERVLDEPAAFARFQDFGESGLMFVLRAYTTLESRWALGSDLRAAILDRFKLEGISIPYPQRDLHIVSDARNEPETKGDH